MMGESLFCKMEVKGVVESGPNSGFDDANFEDASNSATAKAGLAPVVDGGKGKWLL